MHTITLGASALRSSHLIYGCMRIAGDGNPEALAAGKRALLAAYEAGFNHFDHANIYGRGACERLHGELLRQQPELRCQTILTTKCGIRFAGDPIEGAPARYDFTREHILAEVDASLRRLGVDAIDVLLLHRPDYLMQPNEVASAFAELQATGKVRHFGVSNFRPSQVALLQACCPMPLLMNQAEINIHRIAALEDGTLDQCLQLGITPTAWCPLGGVVYKARGNTLTEADEARLSHELGRQAAAYGVEPWMVVLAWLLKLPAGVAPILGSTRPERIAAAPRALDMPYSREDFYRLLEARKGHRVP